MPTCQQIMSVTVSGPFTSGPTSSPSSTSSHQRGSAPRGRSAAYCASMAASSSSVVATPARRRRTSGAPGPSVRSVRTMSRYWAASSGPVDLAEHLARPLVHRPPGELAGLVEHGHQGVAASHPAQRAQRRPPLPGRRRVEGVHAPQRVALQQRPGVVVEVGHLVLAHERVAAHQRRRGDRPLPTASWRVGRVAPQRVVVAVGLGHVTEGVGGGQGVVGRHGVGLGRADARPQPGDALVGDARRPRSRPLRSRPAAGGRTRGAGGRCATAPARRRPAACAATAPRAR